MLHISRGGRVGAALSTVALVASCFDHAPAYSATRDPCELVRSATISKFVGPALVTSGRRLPQPRVEDAERDSCSWRMSPNAPLQNGNDLFFATLELRVNRYQDAFESPDITSATRDADAMFRQYHMANISPQATLGDESGKSYTEDLLAPISSFCVRKANVVIFVQYTRRNPGAPNGTDTQTESGQLEQVAHDIAADALNGLGPPD